jgi:hypothetical protein
VLIAESDDSFRRLDEIRLQKAGGSRLTEGTLSKPNGNSSSGRSSVQQTGLGSFFSKKEDSHDVEVVDLASSPSKKRILVEDIIVVDSSPETQKQTDIPLSVSPEKKSRTN